MSTRNMGILCVVCLAAAGIASASEDRLTVTGTQTVANLLPIQKLDVADVFEAADANHDGRLTYTEAHNYNFLVTQEIFDTYDLDHNGYIDRVEAGLPPVDVKIADIFEAADANHDGKLTFDEAYAYNNMITAAQFYGYDANLDGYVDRTEAGLPADPGKDGCAGCNGSSSKSLFDGDLFTIVLSLFGLAAMAKTARP